MGNCYYIDLSKLDFDTGIDCQHKGLKDLFNSRSWKTSRK